MSVGQAALIHTLFEWLAIFVGMRLYLHGSATRFVQLGQNRHFFVVVGCILGAAVGNKAVHWLDHAERWHMLSAQPWLILQGQSMVGGLLGGLLGVELGKKFAGVQESTGDRFVLPVLSGIFIGRIGCFLAGIHDETYGIATRLPWGVDFGDGIARHPTQLYEMLFVLVLAVFLQRAKQHLSSKPGLQFKLMLAAYLVWRIGVDSLKPVSYAWYGGLSGIQWLCLIALLFYLPLCIAQWRTQPVRLS